MCQAARRLDSYRGVQNQAVATIANWAVAILFSFDILVIKKRCISHSQNDWQVFSLSRSVFKGGVESGG